MLRCCPILLICPFMTGCLVVAYPSVMQTPAIVVTEPDVKAFRVTEESDLQGPHWIPFSYTDSCLVEEIPLTRGEIPQHCDAYFAYEISGLSHSYHSRNESIRLYRRGYETVIIESEPWLACWWKNRLENVSWKKADTLEAREQAIRDLHRMTGAGIVCSISVEGPFVANEYLLLADSPLAAGPEHEKTRERLRSAAQNIKEDRNWKSP
jgi:hypothetical protein